MKLGGVSFAAAVAGPSWLPGADLQTVQTPFQMYTMKPEDIRIISPWSVDKACLSAKHTCIKNDCHNCPEQRSKNIVFYCTANPYTDGLIHAQKLYHSIWEISR